MRYVVCDGTGNILRSGNCRTEEIHLQADVGETALELIEDDKTKIDDAVMKITDGSFAAKDGYAGALPVATLAIRPEV